MKRVSVRQMDKWAFPKFNKKFFPIYLKAYQGIVEKNFKISKLGKLRNCKNTQIMQIPQISSY